MSIRLAQQGAQCSESARREKANAIEPSFGVATVSPNVHFRDAFYNRSPAPDTFGYSPQVTSAHKTGVPVDQPSQPSENDVPVSMVRRQPVAASMTRQRSWEGPLAQQGQRAQLPSARVDCARNLSPPVERSARGELSWARVSQEQPNNAQLDNSRSLRWPISVAAKPDTQLSARLPTRAENSTLQRTKSPRAIRPNGKDDTPSPPGANLARFLQAAMENAPRTLGSESFTESRFALLHSPPSPHALPVVEANNRSETLPNASTSQLGKQVAGESLLSEMYPVPRQWEFPAQCPTEYADTCTGGAAVEEVKKRRGFVAHASDDDEFDSAAADVPSQADVLDCGEPGGAFPSLFGELVCTDVAEQSLTREGEGKKSSDSLETVVAHSCKSDGDTLDTASTSAGQLSVPGSANSLASVVSAAASVAKAAEALSCATDELMASVSRRRLCDLHELSPASVEEELTIAHDAVAAVLATSDMQPSLDEDREEGFMQQMTCHKSTLLKLTNVRKQCIRLEGMGIQ